MYRYATLALAAAVAAAPTPKHPKAPRAATPVRTLPIVASNYTFDVVDTVSAGRTEIVLTNKGPELHHVWLVRLDAGKHLRDVVQAFAKGGPPPAWAHDAGGPNAPAPGASSAAIVDLAPGSYAVLCVIPGPDGKPHVMKGMAKELTVVSVAKASAAMANVAAPDLTIDLADYAFGNAMKLSAGKHVVHVRNGAKQSHEIFVAKLAPGKKAMDLVNWIEKMDGPPPAIPMGGLTGLAPGVSNDMVLDLAPGTYGLYCFVPDAKDGKPHVMHGMMQEIVVK